MTDAQQTLPITDTGTLGARSATDVHSIARDDRRGRNDRVVR